MYRPILDLPETERAIRAIKEFFQINLGQALSLQRVSAPLFVLADTGINDNLNGVEMPISFGIKAMDGRRAEIVQSLAKWKRMALADYGFKPGQGIYTDMNAIRPDEQVGPLHSIYVDQWDWERVMAPGERTLAFLEDIVGRIYEVMLRTEQMVAEKYPDIKPVLPPKIHFVHTTELEKTLPDVQSPGARERDLQGTGSGFRAGHRGEAL